MVLLWLVHGTVCFSFFYLYYLLDISIALLLVLQSFAIGSFCYGVFDYRRAVGAVLCCDDTRWFWVDRFGLRSTLEFSGALLWPNLVVLYFQSVSGAARTVVIFSDSVDVNEMRRLRVLLRL